MQIITLRWKQKLHVCKMLFIKCFTFWTHKYILNKKDQTTGCKPILALSCFFHMQRFVRNSENFTLKYDVGINAVFASGKWLVVENLQELYLLNVQRRMLYAFSFLYNWTYDILFLISELLVSSRLGSKSSKCWLCWS